MENVSSIRRLAICFTFVEIPTNKLGNNSTKYLSSFLLKWSTNLKFLLEIISVVEDLNDFAHQNYQITFSCN